MRLRCQKAVSKRGIREPLSSLRAGGEEVLKGMAHKNVTSVRKTGREGQGQGVGSSETEFGVIKRPKLPNGKKGVEEGNDKEGRGDLSGSVLRKAQSKKGKGAWGVGVIP